MPLLNSSSEVSWGGYANGMIPSSALCGIGVGSLLLRCDAAVAFRLMDQAFTNQFGKRLCATDGYRSLIEQRRLILAKPGLAAVPGTSDHGWGLAADLCGGVESFGTPEHNWLVANAPSFGWRHPAWARQGGSRPEPWHFDFGQLS
jgi:LAS superfamily LD-carboxypeptidase LdcB